MSNEPEAGTISDEVSRTAGKHTTTAAPSESPGATPLILVAIWVGLIAGWLDLGLMVVMRRLIHRDFYRLGEHFVWLIPLGVAVMIFLPGLVLALFARLRRKSVRPGTTLGLLSFIGFLEVC